MKILLITASAATLLLAPVAAHAQDTMGGLGFRTLNDPAGPVAGTIFGFSTSPAIGIRQWFGPRLGLDLGVGFSTFSVEQGPPTTTTDEGTGFVLDVGLPYAAKKWDKVSFIVRPGFQYSRATTEDKQDPTPPNKLTFTAFAVSGELEVEYMFVDKVSISAAHGIAYRSVKINDNDTPENESTLSGFNTGGQNFTQLGFHVYLW